MFPTIEQVKQMSTQRVLTIYKRVRSLGRLYEWEDEAEQTKECILYRNQLHEILNSREHVARKHRSGQNIYDVSHDRVNMMARYGIKLNRKLVRVT